MGINIRSPMKSSRAKRVALQAPGKGHPGRRLALCAAAPGRGGSALSDAASRCPDVTRALSSKPGLATASDHRRPARAEQLKRHRPQAAAVKASPGTRRGTSAFDWEGLANPHWLAAHPQGCAGRRDHVADAIGWAAAPRSVTLYTPPQP
jgi:hypothetical protein